MTTTSASTVEMPRGGLSDSFAMASTGRVVRAVMRKELKQNMIVLGLVLCIEMIVVCAAEWFRTGFLNTFMTSPLNILLYPSVRTAIPLACAAVGLCLGIAQPLADINFDRWAFLIHRPADRRTLFVGRMLAGLVMYFCAVGISLLVLFLVAMSPRGGIYFMKEYTYPPLVDFVTGVIYYFAGLLVCERRARFYGSRLAVLALPLAASFCADMAPWAWLALGADVLFIIPLAVAAMGSAVSHGYTLKAPFYGRVAMALCLLLAFSLPLFVVSLGMRVSIEMFRPRPIQQSPPYPRMYKSFSLMPNGTLGIYNEIEIPDPPGFPGLPHVTAYWNSKHNQRIATFTAYTDLEGNPIPPPSEQNIKQAPDVWMGPRYFQKRAVPGFRQLGSLTTSFLQTVPNARGEPMYVDSWLFDRTREIFSIVRMPPQLEHLGTLGSDGLLSGSGSRAFEEGVVQWPFVVTKHAVYRVKPEKYTATNVFTAAAGEMILNFHATMETSGVVTGMTVGTMSHLYFLSDSGVVIHAIPITHDLHTLSVLVRRFPAQHRTVAVYRDERLFSEGSEILTKKETFWEFYDDQGKLVEARTLPSYLIASPPQLPAVLPANYYSLNAEIDAEHGALVAAANPLLPMVVHLARQGISSGEPDEWFNPLPKLRMTWASVLALLACLAATAGVMLGVARFYRERHAVVWTVVALLTGPAAVMTFLATHRLPRRAECGSCGAMRPLGLLVCPKCGAEWEGVGRNGTEIFVG